MTVKQQKIALKGQAYVAPRAKSFRIANQGVLCSSSGGTISSGGFNLGLDNRTLG